jgi:hypothetical protein
MRYSGFLGMTSECCECYDSYTSEWIDQSQMRENVDQADVVKSAKAPNGEDWRYDCSQIEKMMLEECWNMATSKF